MRFPLKSGIASGLSFLFLLGLGAAPAMARDHGQGHNRWPAANHQPRSHRGGQQYDRRSHRGGQQYDRRSHRGGRQYDRRHHRGRADGRYSRAQPPHRVRHAPRRPVYVQPAPRPVYRTVVVRQPAPYWVRGAHYHGPGHVPTYVVRDYRHYGLRHPPRGHYWRRSDAGDFLLVAIATGIIVDMIVHR